MTSDHPYRERWAVLATRHGKGPLIAPVMESRIGLSVVEEAVDTDSLGTFSGEIERVGSSLETAIAKAHLAIEATGSPLALASEGSIGPDHDLAGLIVDIELIVLIDTERNIVITQSASSLDLIVVHEHVTSSDPLDDLGARADLGRHHLIVRTPQRRDLPPIKGIATLDGLRAAIQTHERVNDGEAVIAETDLRAHLCPRRQVVIRSAAQRLAERVATLCVHCSAPGWGEIAIHRGAPCRLCARPTAVIARREYGCVSCEHREFRDTAPPGGADPSRCPYCNP